MNKKLLRMLSYCRPAGSESEKEFIRRYIVPLGAKPVGLNWMVQIPGDTETLFSCHTDTVHHKGGFQQVAYDMNMKMAFKEDKECLGADDTAGVWLMIEMIKAKVPGTYMFHYGEERGCIGSKWMADKNEEFLKQFKRAVAFDRRGHTSIITHQMSRCCCSDTFGDALAAQLGLDYKRDDTGLYTDTASYAGIIPECTNISVGYNNQHCASETLDCGFLEEVLLPAVLNINWGDLPTERDPKKTSWKGQNYKPHYQTPTPGGYSPPASSSESSNVYKPRWGADKQQMYMLTEANFDGTAVDDATLMACRDIETLDDAMKMCRNEMALAARYLYAFVLQKDSELRAAQLRRAQSAANTLLGHGPEPKVPA